METNESLVSLRCESHLQFHFFVSTKGYYYYDKESAKNAE